MMTNTTDRFNPDEKNTPKERVFSVAYGADKLIGYTLRYRYVAWSVSATSFAEAMGKGFIRCKGEKGFPSSEGWGNHSVSVMEIVTSLEDER